MEVDRLDEWPTKGRLGRRNVCCLSTPNNEVRLDSESKCLDLFSRREDCNANPESFLEVGVVGRLGKDPDVGDDFGDDGEPSCEVELESERSSLPCSSLEWRKALKTSGSDVRFEEL